MEDEAGGDEKIIAVPSSKLTRRYEKVQNYTDLPEITLQQIQHFFEHYKDLEPGKWVKVLGWGGADEAKADPRGHRARQGEEIKRRAGKAFEERPARAQRNTLPSGHVFSSRAQRRSIGAHTAGSGSPVIAQAARSVFTSRHATVICPTPPGTGVIAPATFERFLERDIADQPRLAVGHRAGG